MIAAIAAILALTAALTGQPIPDLAPQVIVPALPDPIIACLTGRLRQEPTHPLLLWARNVMADGGSPCWKREAARRAILGRTEADCAKTTNYCWQCDPSSRSGGNKYVPGWTCAASRNIAIGSVVYVAGEGLRLVTDRGGAVHVGGVYTRHGETANLDLFAGRRCPQGCNDGTRHGVRVWVVAVLGKGAAR